MKHLALVAALALSLAACGPGTQRADGGAGASDACPLLADPSAVFGEGAQSVHGGRLDAIADTCSFASADGARGGDVMTYTAESLGSMTPDARMSEVLASWDAMTETPLAPAEGLGEEARKATDLPGYQTQIAFMHNGALVLVSARSGDDSITGEQLALNLAHAVAAAPAP